MNTGLAILIARTKTHPEEFTGYDYTNMIASKWVTMIENFTQYMTYDEKEEWEEAKIVLNEWYANKRRDDFTEQVMKELAGADDDGVSLTSVSHNDVNPLNSYQQLRGMGQQGLRVSTQSDDSNSLYSVPSLQKSSEENNLLSQIAKRMGRK